MRARISRLKDQKLGMAAVVALMVMGVAALAVAAQVATTPTSMTGTSLTPQVGTVITGKAPSAQSPEGEETPGLPDGLGARGPSELSSGAPSDLPPGVHTLATAPSPAPRTIPRLAPLDPSRVAVWRVATARKVVALTFDDGPSPYTPLVMSALEKADVPATFFCVGQHVEQYSSEVAAEKTAGFEVENHTWDHRLLTQLPYETILREITATEAVLGPTRFIRPPGGYYNPLVRDAAASLGMKVIRWDVDTRDWQHQEVPWILSRVQSEVHPGSIILMSTLR